MCECVSVRACVRVCGWVRACVHASGGGPGGMWGVLILISLLHSLVYSNCCNRPCFFIKVCKFQARSDL